jgi:hypothetical protein
MNARTTMLALLAGIGLALTLGAASPAAAQKVVATANGGGEAVFSDPSNACFGGTTMFGLGVTIRSDGSAKGHFECNFGKDNAKDGVGGSLSVVAISGVASPGSVTFSGPITIRLAGGESFVLPFLASVTMTAGGPGVGTFNFCPAVCDPNSACDLETVVVGKISIHTP